MPLRTMEDAIIERVAAQQDIERLGARLPIVDVLYLTSIYNCVKRGTFTVTAWAREHNYSKARVCQIIRKFKEKAYVSGITDD